ncbi:MAG TPA: glycolate oxidase subunit GlcE [Telluria sp.]
MQDVIEQFRARVLEGRPLRIRGGGTKDFYGQSLAGEVLDTRAYSGIIDYEPTELVITARSGTPLAEIEAALAAQGQMLAFEPPHFGAGATLGGAIASGLSGPRRASSGAVRDFVLGTIMMDAKGEVLRFGGQVMKNVAGYDVSRLLAGSLGTLGLMLEHSVKVLPRPVAETTLRFDMEESEALRRLNLWGGQPLPVSASCWHDGVLSVRLSGAHAAVEAAVRSLGGERIDDAGDFWNSLREQRLAFFDGAEPLWRLSLPTTAGPLELRGKQLIEWGGAQRWLRADANQAVEHGIRRAAGLAGGHATLFRGGDKSVGVFQPLAPVLAKVNQRMKDAFDPSNIFNPGRMY